MPSFLVRLLGSPSIEGPDGTLQGAAVQRHRLALLALLALAPRQSLSRERLMSLLWPEASTGKARNLLNAAVHSVRRALGEGVLLTQGGGIALDPDQVRIDVLEFERALHGGNPAQAVELYSGPFLDGLGLPGAVEFERWQETERDRLEERFRGALEHVALAVGREHGPAEAVQWWRRRLACTPLDARVTTRLMDTLAAVGDRAEALRVAATHAQLMEAELGVGSDGAVVELAERLRTEVLTRAPSEWQGSAAQDGPGSSLPTPAGLRSESHRAVDGESNDRGGIDTYATEEARPVHGRSGRLSRKTIQRMRFALSGAATLAGVALTWTLFSRPNGDSVEPDRVAVIPFVNRMGTDSLDFGAILAEVLGDRLEHTGLVRVVPSASVAAALAVTGSSRESPDPQALRDLTGAGLIIHGSYFVMNDSLAIQPQIIEVMGKPSLAPIELVIVAPNELQRGIRLVQERVQIALSTRINPLLAAVGRGVQLPISLEAYAAYVNGMERYREADYDAALPNFLRAAELDPTSASPVIWAAVTVWNSTGNIPATDSLLRIAQRRSDLRPFDAAQLDWLRAYVDGDYRAAGEAAQRRAVLGGRLFSGGAVQNKIQTNRLSEALNDIEQLHKMSDFERRSTPTEFLATILHVRGDHTREWSEVRETIDVVGNDHTTLKLEAHALAALGRIDDLRLVLQPLSALPFSERNSGIFRDAAAELRVHGWAAEAEEIGRLAAAYYENAIVDSASWSARFLLAATLAELGGADRDRARSMFESLAHEGLPGPFTWPHARGEDAAVLGYLGTIAAGVGDTARADAYILQLSRLDRKYLRGAREHWQARIAAQLGQCVRAVRFLHDAFDRGWPYYDPFDRVNIAEAPEFMGLQRRGCAEYDRFIEPR